MRAVLGPLLAAALGSLFLAVAAEAADPQAKLARDTIVVYPILGDIGPSYVGTVRSEVSHLVDDRGARILVFDISSPGGDLVSGFQIADLLLELRSKKNVDVYAYIGNRTQARQAAAIVALAAPTIVMADDTRIGEIIAESGEGDQTRLLAIAEANGYPRALIEGMASTTTDVYELIGGTIDGRRFVTRKELDAHVDGRPQARAALQPRLLTQPGKALLLDEKQAFDCKISNKTATSIDYLVTDYGLDGELLRAHRDFDRLSGPLSDSAWARFLDYAFVKFLLIVIGIIGVAIEFKMTGTLLPGGIGLTAFLIFFLGGWANGNVQWPEVAMFLVSGVLIAVEIFVIPGFGFAGLSGLALLFASLVLALRPSGQLTVEVVVNDSILVIASLAVAIVGIVSFLWVFPKLGFAERSGIVRSTNLAGGPAHPGADPETGSFDFLLDKVGTLLTDCRPVGRARISGREVDVVTDRGFLARGSEVRVTRVEGNRIVVSDLV
ncbi:MAG: hypothetical protein KDC38_10725 [Planctomycetes bacterium]|nr:hypothetical protein [Planctomycetota bacterium]